MDAKGYDVINSVLSDAIIDKFGATAAPDLLGSIAFYPNPETDEPAQHLNDDENARIVTLEVAIDELITTGFVLNVLNNANMLHVEGRAQKQTGPYFKCISADKYGAMLDDLNAR